MLALVCRMFHIKVGSQMSNMLSNGPHYANVVLEPSSHWGFMPFADLRMKCRERIRTVPRFQPALYEAEY